MRKWILLVALLVSQGVQDASAYYTANMLLAECEGDSVGGAICRGYIMGVVEASENKTWEGTP